MATCKAVTRRGAPCRQPALPGSNYCRFHAHLVENVAMDVATNVATEEEHVVIKTGREKVRVRYLGRGSYWVAGYEFTPETPVHEVPEKLAEYLLQTELFELEE